MSGQFDANKWRAFYEHDAGKIGRELAYKRLDIVFRKLNKFLKKKKDVKRVLDIGISDGYLMKRMVDIGVIVYGMDISYSMIRLARNNFSTSEKGALFMQGSITHLPFADSSFDAITACEVLEHLDENNFLQAIKELKRILVTGGGLFITTPYNENIMDSIVKCPECGSIFPTTGHYSNFDEKKWQSLASDFNFSRIDIKKIYGTDFRLKKFRFLTPLIRLAARLFSVDSLTKMFVIVKKNGSFGENKA